MVPDSGSGDLCSLLHLNNIENIQRPDIANLIYNAFLEPTKAFNPLTTLPALDINSSFLELDVLEAYSPGKAPSPDNIPNWFVKEYSEILVQPVNKILNSSFAEQQLPYLGS